MLEATDLLPPDLIVELLGLSREFRQSGGHGFIKVYFQHGYPSEVGSYKSKKYPPKKQIAKSDEKA